MTGVGVSGRRPYAGAEHKSHCSCTYEVDALRAALTRLYEAGLRAHSKSQDLIDALEATRTLLEAAPARAEATTTT